MIGTTATEMVVTGIESIRFSVEVRWRRIGRITWDDKGDPAFPETTRETGLYRFHLYGEGRTKCYVGETVELRPRFSQFRKSGRSQDTNIRIRKALQEHPTIGGTVEVDIATGSVDMTVGDDTTHVDLADNAQRKFLEHVALVMETASGMNVLNT